MTKPIILNIGLHGSPSLKMGSWNWFVWLGGLMMTWSWCVSGLICSCFFVSMMPSSISPTRYQKTNFGEVGEGGDKGVQGYQCKQQAYKTTSRVYTIIDEVSFA